MTERANLLVASPYNDERKRFSNLFAGHDTINIKYYLAHVLDFRGNNG